MIIKIPELKTDFKTLIFTILTVIFIVTPLLSNFRLIDAVSYGDFFILLVFVYVIMTENISLNINRLHAILLLISLTFFSIIFFDYFNNNRAILSVVRHSFYIIVFFFIVNFCDRSPKIIIRAYMGIAVIFSILLLLQKTYYMISGHYFLFFNPEFEIEKNYLYLLNPQEKMNVFRTGGMFREPSYFVIFSVPALLISAKMINPFLFIFFSLAVFMSTSTLGIFFLILSSLLFLYYRKLSLINYVYFILFCIIISFLFLNYMDFSRHISIFTGGGSFMLRILLPFSRFFEDGSKLILPHSDLIFAALDNRTSDLYWYNSFIYSLALFGTPVIFVFISILRLTKNSIYFLAIFFLLISTNALSTPFLLVDFAILYSAQKYNILRHKSVKELPPLCQRQ